MHSDAQIQRFDFRSIFVLTMRCHRDVHKHVVPQFGSFASSPNVAS